MWKFVLIVSLVFACAFAAHAQTPSRPNILLIVADDLGYADIGAQGVLSDVKTPNVDAIAKAGTRFTNGYVSCPICSPSRAGLLTGRYQTHFGHEFNPGQHEVPNFGLPLDQVTIAQALKSAGYTTGAIGKWHEGYTPEMHPQKRGFDEFFGFLGGSHSYLDPGPGRLPNNQLRRGDTLVPSVTYLTDDFGREAASFVDRHAKETNPFFLYLAFNAVHVPQQATQKYLDRFTDEPNKMRRIMLAQLSALDDAVGQVLSTLRENKIEDNTLIIFLSDNGGPTPTNGSRNDPLRGHKGQMLEGGIRVAYMMQWNHHIPAGKVYDKPVISLDIFPTALAAAGARAPEKVKFDGVNLLPFLKGESELSPHESLYWRIGAAWAIRDELLKLVNQPGEGTRLYDLSADIRETKDLSDARPEDRKRLQEKYDAWNALNIPARWPPQNPKKGQAETND
ncbi:MAG TPA: sulfatase-like hydrolase/transferase [Tepidisphaeraceae bacterium]|nr:sulfatase-like hydrolase/transferase [Tepidisphaeraceae bacterium]